MVLKYLLIGVVSTASVAYADEVKLPTEYTLKLNSDEINLISEGLQTQPYGKVFPLINKLRQQILEQQQAVKQVPAKPLPKPEIKDK